MIQVEVFYAPTVSEQYLLKARVPEGADVRTAIEASGLLELVPGLELERIDIGIFAQKVALKTLVTEGDRVEIYRDLLVDPKENRRLRSKRK